MPDGRNPIEPAERLDTTTRIELARQSLRILVGLLCLGLLLVCVFLGESLLHRRAVPTPAARMNAMTVSTAEVCGVSADRGPPIQVEMVASPPLIPWLEQAAKAFVRLCPQVHVRLLARDDFEAATALRLGALRPTIWAPRDVLLLSYLEQIRQPATPRRAPDEPTELLASPLVALFFEDRLKLLSYVLRVQPSAEGPWVRGLCAGIPRDPSLAGLANEAMTPGRWVDLYAPLLAGGQAGGPRRGRTRMIRPAGDGLLLSMSEVESWGLVKIGHPRPTRFPAGLAALYLMSRDYLLTGAEATNSDASSADDLEAALRSARGSLRTWLRRCEAGLEQPVLSEQALTEAMFNQGPSYLDGIITYEHLALPVLERIDESIRGMKKMSVLYPQPTLVARHPAVIFDSEAAQKEAARHFLGFLRSPAIQEQALPFGFRPVIREVSIRHWEPARNRFLRLRRYGVLPAPSIVEAPRPSGRVLVDLIETWGDATGRN